MGDRYIQIDILNMIKEEICVSDWQIQIEFKHDQRGIIHFHIDSFLAYVDVCMSNQWMPTCVIYKSC